MNRTKHDMNALEYLHEVMLDPDQPAAPAPSLRALAAGLSWPRIAPPTKWPGLFVARIREIFADGWSDILHEPAPGHAGDASTPAGEGAARTPAA
ncbi:MAG: hypothetical protein FJW30_00090 [Acidobacteria bacterium]|nr:hypothetical protein [Acidobacteriota bacterium]